mgnify:CR=1 FL=1
MPTKTGVFLSVEGAVGIPQPVDSYNLTLAFPVALHPLDSVIAFTADNRTPSVYERDILGALQGSAYEEPLRSGLTAPYAALTDFGRALVAAYRRIEDRAAEAARAELVAFESDLENV